VKLLGHQKRPGKDIRPTKYIDPIVIRSENGHRVINTKRQESSATEMTKVTPSAKKRKSSPQAKLSSSDEESSKGTINSSSKNSGVEKEDEVIHIKSFSDESDKSSPSDDSSSSSDDSETSKDEVADKVAKKQEEAIP
jgi:hypothetical protein